VKTAPTSSLLEGEGWETTEARGTNVFHFGQDSKSRLASRTTSSGLSMVIVVRTVHRPPVGYVGVGSGATASVFIDELGGDTVEAILV
jgi:hypothetical protein